MNSIRLPVLAPMGKSWRLPKRSQPTREGKGDFILWDVNIHKPLGPPLEGAPGECPGVGFGMEGKSFVSWNHKGKIILWTMETREAQRTSPPSQAEEITAVALSPNEKTLAFAVKTKESSKSGHGAVIVVFWDVLGQKELGRWRGSWMTHCLAFSPNSRTLAVNGEDEIFLLDTETQTTLGDSFRGFEGLITDIAFSPDGQTLAASTNLSGSDDGALTFGNGHPTAPGRSAPGARGGGNQGRFQPGWKNARVGGCRWKPYSVGLRRTKTPGRTHEKSQCDDYRYGLQPGWRRSGRSGKRSPYSI